jgi:hypothetical protein
MPSVVRIHSCPLPVAELLLKYLSHSTGDGLLRLFYSIATYCYPIKTHKSVGILTLTDTFSDTYRHSKKKMALLMAESEIPVLHYEIGRDVSKDWDDYPLLRFIQDANGPRAKGRSSFAGGTSLLCRHARMFSAYRSPDSFKWRTVSHEPANPQFDFFVRVCPSWDGYRAWLQTMNNASAWRSRQNGPYPRTQSRGENAT